MRCLLAAGLLVLGSTASLAEQADPLLGAEIARSFCARCHALAADQASTNPSAPPMPVIARRFPGATLLPRLEQGLTMEHPDMPEVRLAPAEIDAFLAWLDGL